MQNTYVHIHFQCNTALHSDDFLPVKALPSTEVLICKDQFDACSITGTDWHLYYHELQSHCQQKSKIV